MGVVYKAEDTKLERSVALKFLPAHLLGNEDVRKRFEREAKAAAALHHPNICPVYEIDEAEGRSFISMAFIDGESLDKKIAKGPLTLDQASDVAQQVARGLEAAHEKGIFHRDIKPENIIVDPKGHTTIMDFGLAQLTEASRLTRADETMGTVAYMSPEQTEGSGTDHRTDIWSLGVVMYEMISGQQPFRGDYDKAVMYSILNEQPEPLTAVRTGIPMELERVVGKCLDKHSSRRYQNIADLYVDLSRLASGSGPTGGLSAVKPAERSTQQPSRKQPSMGLTLGATALALLVAWGAYLVGRQSSSAPPLPDGARASWLTIDTSEAAPLAFGSRATVGGVDLALLAVSPNGQTIVFAAERDGVSKLYRRDLDSLEIQPIEGTEGVGTVFFSPDGRSLGFLTADKVKSVDLSGGNPRVLCDATLPTRATWLPNNSVYFATAVDFATLFRLPAGGGTVEELPWTGGCRFVEALPDGRHALAQCFTGSLSGDYGDVRVVNIESGESTTVIENGYGPQFVGDGFILFGRSGDLFAVRFDGQSLSTVGAPRRVVSGVHVDPTFGIIQVSVSENGVLAYIPGGDASRGRPAWVDRHGAVEVVDVPEKHYGAVDVAPNGRRFAVHVFDVRDYIQIIDDRLGETLRLQGQGHHGLPRWARRDNRIAFTVRSSDGENSIAIETPGSGRPPVTVTVDQQLPYVKTWGPRDESVIVGTFPISTTRMVSEAGRLELPKGFEGTDFFADLSPDGHWLAEFRDGHIEVRSLDGEREYQISPGFGIEPRWCRECDELFYRSDNQIYSVKVRFGSELEWERPQLAFEVPRFLDTPTQSFDVSPDGQRVLALVREGEFTRTKIHVVQNWTTLFNESVND